MSNQIICINCGYSYDDPRTDEQLQKDDATPVCPLCSGGWDVWELRFAPIPLEKNRAQIASWLGQLPFPSAIDLVCTEKGIRLRMFTTPESADGAIRSWAAMTHQQTRWVKLPASAIPQSEMRFALKNTTHVPSVSLTDRGGDPMLAVSGYLMNHRGKSDNGIRLWFTGKDPELQAKLQALVSYSYGTESGVGDLSPNPWGIRLTMLRVLVAIGIIGRLVPVKNHSLFIKALKRVLNNTNGKVKAFIIGDGESRTGIEQLASNLEIKFSRHTDKEHSHPVVFTSWRTDVDTICAGLDIIALTSLNEGTPVSLIEAQAAGKPIVSTRVGGIADVVLEDQTALLSDINDEKLFAENLLRLVNDVSLRHKFSDAGRDFVISKFSYHRLVNDMSNLYHDLLDKKNHNHKR